VAASCESAVRVDTVDRSARLRDRREPRRPISDERPALRARALRVRTPRVAAVFVAFTYIYLSAMAFLFGVQFDAILRQRVSGSPTGGKLHGSTRRRSPVPAGEPWRSRSVRS
jgi:hypothetical protein